MAYKPMIRIVVVVRDGTVAAVYHEINEQEVGVVIANMDIEEDHDGYLTSIEGAQAFFEAIPGDVDREYVAEVFDTVRILEARL